MFINIALMSEESLVEQEVHIGTKIFSFVLRKSKKAISYLY